MPALAKACGYSSRGPTVSVLDATAGLGRDGIVLSHLGFQVVMVERHGTLAELLRDGLQRAAAADPSRYLAVLAAQRARLVTGDADQLLRSIAQQEAPAPAGEQIDPSVQRVRRDPRAVLRSARVPQVVYVDEMFPAASDRQAKKASLPKGEVQMLRALASPGSPETAAVLVQSALSVASRRVVAKVPARSAPLDLPSGRVPDFAVSCKTVRFDVYVQPHPPLG